MFIILVIEDDEMLNAGICFNIQNNKMEALSTYCIILLDVNLPDGNGFEFAKIIKEEYHIPFIFLTAHNLDEEILDGFELRSR